MNGPPPGYGPPPRYGPLPVYGPPPVYEPPPRYGPLPVYGPPPRYGPLPVYGPPRYGPPGYGPRPGGYPIPGYGPTSPPGYGPPPGWGRATPASWTPSGPAVPAWALPPPRLKGGNEKTGPLPLHPMGVGDILDGAVKLLRANARTMIILVTAFVVPLELLLAFLQRDLYGGTSFLKTLSDPTAASAQTSRSDLYGLQALAYLGFWIALPLVCAGASRVVMASYLGGELRAQDAMRAVWKHAPALIAATLIVHLLEVISLVGLVVGAILVMPLFMMTAPAISLEDLGPLRGVRRSVALARRRYWPTVGIALLSAFMAFVLNSALSLIPSTLGLIVGLRWGWLFLALGGVLEALVTVSFVAIVATLVYIDARIRQEGFDLQVISAQLETR